MYVAQEIFYRYQNEKTTRPIISYSGTLLYHLGVWVNLQPQKVVTVKESYINTSKEIRISVMTLSNIPHKSWLFTADTTLMYTNIDTNKAIIKISQWIYQREKWFTSISTDYLINALVLTIKNNVFRFGNIFLLPKKQEKPRASQLLPLSPSYSP